MNKEVEYLKKENISEYIEFIKKVFDYDIKQEMIEKLIDENNILVIMNQNKIIASVIIKECFEYIKAQKYYQLEYFGVLKEYRRMGYATMLFDKIKLLIKENNVDYIEITSGNHRKAAHYFYQANNFKIKDTTVFVKFF